MAKDVLLDRTGSGPDGDAARRCAHELRSRGLYVGTLDLDVASSPAAIIVGLFVMTSGYPFVEFEGHEVRFVRTDLAIVAPIADYFPD